MSTLSRTIDSRSDRRFNAVNGIVLGLFALSILYPLVYVTCASVSDPSAVISGRMWLWPVDGTLEAYRTVAEYNTIVRGFANSGIYAIGGAAIAVVLTMLAAYPLSRRDLYGVNWIMVLFLIPMFFAGGMIPMYLVIKDLGMLNTRWAIMVPGALTTFNVIITRTFFRINIPDELHEAARVDGCSDWRFFLRIVLPLSKPIIAVMFLFAAVSQWNNWFQALIYLTNESLYPLQLVLRQILILNSLDPSAITDPQKFLQLQELRDLLKFAVIVVSMVPPLVLYPFVQRHFVKGVMIGSVKG